MPQVFNRYRQAWEVPGGMLGPGESPQEAAVRELDEESGQRGDTLELAGVALIRVRPTTDWSTWRSTAD
ncbi:NUDIX hydrolase [Kribbella sp. NPDC004536]|uniref:NUDIX hydrolase n=1 Tax=Kribbella sp. NPDC004536 TaxID=3364106 RepID=UPI0036B9CB87